MCDDDDEGDDDDGEDDDDDDDGGDDDDDDHRHRDETHSADDHTDGAQTGWTSKCVRVLPVWAGGGAQAAICLVIPPPRKKRLQAVCGPPAAEICRPRAPEVCIDVIVRPPLPRADKDKSHTTLPRMARTSSSPAGVGHIGDGSWQSAKGMG